MAKESLELENRPGTGLSVYNELDRLEKLLLWGEPGTEAVLGQLYPYEISLFFKRFDVPKARSEFSHMQDLITNQGVKVVRAKDVYVDILNGLPSGGLPSLAELGNQIRERCLKIYNEYRLGSLAVLDWVDPILNEDAERFGEELAVKLNLALSLAPEIPMANIIYGRDQSNVFGNMVVMSRMRWPIRRPEVEVYNAVYDRLNLKNRFQVTGGYIEGGDGMMLENHCFIGVGVRTTREAITQLVKAIGPDLQENSITIVVAVDPDMENMHPDQAGPEMDAMHWDTWIAPIDSKTVIACSQEIDKRQAEEVTLSGDEVIFHPKGRLSDYITQKGFEIHPISKSVQENFATNYLHLGDSRVIVPLSQNAEVTEAIESRGGTVIPAEINELVGGYGAVHCMTASLIRAKPNLE